MLTPPQSQEKVSEVARLEMIDQEVQTEQVPGKEDRVEGKLDSLKAEVAEALMSVFQYMEQLKSINLSQEQLILRLNTKLNQAETREREAREKEREDRARRRSREQDRDRRVVRGKSRGRDRSRDDRR